MSVSPEERERVFEAAWQKGNGFRFMFWTFNDLTVSPEANEEACKFIRKKIRETVKDQDKAEKLCPTEPYARRPLCDAGYYEQFNRPNVDIFDLKANPIQSFTPTGITTKNSSTGEEETHELDVVIFATGFDAVDGNYTRVAIKGRNGESLRDHWQETGPTTYLGVCVPDFPNLFMITGPNGPFTNIPPTLETHVEFITELIGQAEIARSAIPSDRRKTARMTYSLKPCPEAEESWTQHCKDISDNSLFRKTSSWIFGANVSLGHLLETPSGMIRHMFQELRLFTIILAHLCDSCADITLDTRQEEHSDVLFRRPKELSSRSWRR